MILLRKTFTQWDATDNLKRMKDADILAESKKPTSNYGEAAKAGLVGAATIGGIGSAVSAGLAAKNGTSIMKGLSRGGKLGAIAGGLTAAGIALHKGKKQNEQNQFYNQRLEYAQQQALRRERKDWKQNMTQRDGYSY